MTNGAYVIRLDSKDSLRAPHMAFSSDTLSGYAALHEPSRREIAP